MVLKVHAVKPRKTTKIGYRTASSPLNHRGLSIKCIELGSASHRAYTSTQRNAISYLGRGSELQESKLFAYIALPNMDSASASSELCRNPDPRSSNINLGGSSDCHLPDSLPWIVPVAFWLLITSRLLSIGVVLMNQLQSRKRSSHHVPL